MSGAVRMNTLISTKQLKYAVAGFIIASSLLTSNLYAFTKNESWISVVIGFIFSFAIIGIYAALLNKHPGLSLTEVNEKVYGKILGKAVSLLYIFYFLSLSYLNTRVFGDFIKSMLLPSTPMMIIIAAFLAVCAMAVRKGPVKMTRYGLLLTAIAIAAILFNTLLLINKIDMRNLQPVLTLPVQNYLIGSHFVTMLPLCEIMAFMTYAPFMLKPAEFGKAMRGGLAVGGATLLYIVLRDISVLGDFTRISTMPAFSAIRLIDIGDILTRLEIIYAVTLMMEIFLKVSVVYYATVSCLRGLFGTGSYDIFIYVIGVLTAIYAVVSFPAGAEHTKWQLSAAATYSSFFLLVLPLATLIVSAVRGAGKSRMTKTGE